MDKWVVLSALTLLSCLCLSVIGQTPSSNSDAWTPELLPDDPKLIVGQPLVMICGLKCNCSTCPSGRCVENLIFSINRKYQKQMELLKISRADPWFAILNATHAQLNLSDISSDFDHATVSCYQRGYENRFIDSQIIRVGYLPSAPKINYHRVVNWENFVFKWNFSRIPNMVYQAFYTAWFKPPGYSDFISCLQCNGVRQECPHQITRNYSGSCTVKHALDLVHPSGRMQFKVNATNLLGQVVSEPELMSLDLYHHIEPAPVKNLEIISSGTNAPRVLFSSPKFGSRLTYNLTVVCGSAFSKSWTNYTHASKYTESLTDLPCYANCSLSVECKPLYVDSHYGYWSESVVKNFVSQEGAPLFAPETCTSCFQSVLSGNHSLRSVFLFYKYLDTYKARGVVTKYRSFKLSSSASRCRVNWTADCAVDFVTADANASSIHWMLPLEQRFRLAIEASTVAGYNASLSFNSTNHVVDLPLHSTSHNWQVQWSVSNLTAFLINDRFVKMSWLKHRDAVHYVVVWCVGSRNDMRCTGEVDWHFVTLSQTSYTIHTNQSPTNYLFGVAIETSQGSSGVYWNDCLYNSWKAANPPYVKEKSAITTITLNIDGRSWRSCEQRKGYVFAYQIVYWVTSQSRDDAQTVLVDLSEYDSDTINYDLENLLAETSYTVAVFSVTLTGPSQTNFTVYPVTKPPGMRPGGITGIAIGSLIGLLLIIFGIVTCFRKIRHVITNWCMVKVLPPSHENFHNEVLAKSRFMTADDRDCNGGPDGSALTEDGKTFVVADIKDGARPREQIPLLAMDRFQQLATSDNASSPLRSLVIPGAAFDLSRQSTSSHLDEDEQTTSDYRSAEEYNREFLPVDKDSAPAPVHYSCVAERGQPGSQNPYAHIPNGSENANSGGAIGCNGAPTCPGNSSDVTAVQMEGVGPNTEYGASGSMEPAVSYSVSVGSGGNSDASGDYMPAAETVGQRTVDGSYSIAEGGRDLDADGIGSTSNVSSAGSGYSREANDSSASDYFRVTDDDATASGYSVGANEPETVIASGGYSRATGNLDMNNNSRVTSGGYSRDAGNSGTSTASGGYSQAAYNSGTDVASARYYRGSDGSCSSSENNSTNTYSLARVDNGFDSGDSNYDSTVPPGSPNPNGSNSGYSTAVVADHLDDGLNASGRDASQAAENDLQDDDGHAVGNSGGYLSAAVVDENTSLNIDYSIPPGQPGQLEIMIDDDDAFEMALAPISRHSSVDSYGDDRPADYCSASRFPD